VKVNDIDNTFLFSSTGCPTLEVQNALTWVTVSLAVS